MYAFLEKKLGKKVMLVFEQEWIFDHLFFTIFTKKFHVLKCLITELNTINLIKFLKDFY